MIPEFQLFLCIGVRPEWLDKWDGMAHITCGEHQGISHSTVIPLLRRQFLTVLPLCFPSNPVLCSGLRSENTVTRSVQKHIRFYIKLLFGRQLLRTDGRNFLPVTDHLRHLCIQIELQLLLIMDFFPQNRIEDRVDHLRIPPFVFQKDFF